MKNRHEEEGIPESMEYQLDALSEAEVSSVLDVGSGPGSLLLKLLQRGITRVIGLDLSPEMNDIAEQRLHEAQYDDQFLLINGSFLSTEINEQIEAISMHRVLCCHPNKEGMVERSAEYQPKIITITIPRDWKILRFLVGILGILARITNSFRPYIHPQKSIDDLFHKLGYRTISQQKGFWWVTTTYQRVEEH